MIHMLAGGYITGTLIAMGLRLVAAIVFGI
jgi:hypothetical protein